MKRLIDWGKIVAVLGLVWLGGGARGWGTDRLESLQREFAEYSGVRLVFHRHELPSGDYYSIMPALSPTGMTKAAEICLEEVKKYPRGYLGQVGLKAIGVFAACASRTTDGFRPYLVELGGYRYYGMWQTGGGIAAAYYTDEQLPLTFHHEIFHHIQATRHGVTDWNRYANGRDSRYHEAVTGVRPYSPPAIKAKDLASLRRIRQGKVLRGAASAYAAKNETEDQAETVRYFLTNLCDSLLQVIERPSLPGSQRILHCLRCYREAGTPGPGIEWFVDVALGRAEQSGEAAPATDVAPHLPDILARLRSFAGPGPSAVAQREDEARALLAAAARIDLTELTPAELHELADLAAAITDHVVRSRLGVKGTSDAEYVVRGEEDANGVNWTLRRDVAALAGDAQRLKLFAELIPAKQERLLRTQIQELRLMARYYAFIQSQWSVSSGTRQVFESTRDAFADALPAAQKSFSTTIRSTELSELAVRLPADGTPQLLDRLLSDGREMLPTRQFSNSYLDKVDEAISDPVVRAAIRRVQPACVRLPGASGCCISPRGVILTAAHVAGRYGRTMTVGFPDGSKYLGNCTVINRYLDVAVVQIEGVRDLPFAPLAATPPAVGTWICVVGQPGSSTSDGRPTGYEPFCVSTGRIRGFTDDNHLASQVLGVVKHSAWTYWGHSGSPLFDARGRIVAMHNSWDSRTATRHGVTHEAITYFLRQSGVDFAVAP